MACNNSAILDVVVENKEIPSLIHDSKDYDYSNASNLDNTFLQPPSSKNLNTVQEVENLSELKIEDDSDLSVTVDNPQKVLDTLETYITFRIITKTARMEFAENEYIVRRRYNDFVWLRQKLADAHPFCIIPPLPAKHTLIGQLDRYSRDFVLVRMKALNVFVKRVVQHPILSCNEHFKVFITAKQGQFNLYRKQKSNSEHRIRTLNNAHRASVKSHHIEFDQMNKYLVLLHERLSCIERITGKMHREKHELVNDLGNLQPIFTSWVFTDPNLSRILGYIGKAIETWTNAENNIAFSYPATISSPVKELLSYIDAVQEALRKRETYQQAYECSVGELSRRHIERDRVRVYLVSVGRSENMVPYFTCSVLFFKFLAGSSSTSFTFWKQPANDDRLCKLNSHISQLEKRVEVNQDTLECANECLRSDLERWQQEKDDTLRKILQDFVTKQVEYHTACARAWGKAMNEFTASLQTSKK